MVRAIKEPKIVPWGTEERVSFSVEDSVTWGGTGVQARAPAGCVFVKESRKLLQMMLVLSNVVLTEEDGGLSLRNWGNYKSQQRGQRREHQRGCWNTSCRAWKPPEVRQGGGMTEGLEQGRLSEKWG